MGIIIGFKTTASVGSACAVSASWGASPNTQHLYCLSGNFTPFMSISKPTESANITCYSPGPSVDVGPSTDCDTHDAACTVSVNISPGSCGGFSGAGISGNMMPISYSWSREDITLPGQESWSLQRYVGDNIPTYVIRGISEGSSCEGSGIVVVNGVSATSGNISAGGAVGRADTMTIGQVTTIGAGDSTGDATGQGSASIQYTPLWV